MMAEKMIEKRRAADEGMVIPRLWSIVPAGAEGKRLATMNKSWLGEQSPERYCTFGGTRFMLGYTVDRADCLAVLD